LSFGFFSSKLWNVAEDKTRLALLLSASLIAAVRTARDEIKRSPKVLCAISDSITLARMILERLDRDAVEAEVYRKKQRPY
jgi:hypothetical protein